MAWLGQEILDPVIDELGAICITYGYAGRNLTRSIKSRISPDLDQHAGCELAGNSAPICRRDGQAVDFEVPWATVLITVGVAIVAALVMSWFPARQASNILPAEALRYE